MQLLSVPCARFSSSSIIARFFFFFRLAARANSTSSAHKTHTQLFRFPSLIFYQTQIRRLLIRSHGSKTINRNPIHKLLSTPIHSSIHPSIHPSSILTTMTPHCTIILSGATSRQQRRSALEQSSSDELTSTSLSSSSRGSSISFGTIEVREYDRVLAVVEHVQVSNALAIGWDYEQRQAVSLEEFEQQQLRAKIEQEVRRLGGNMQRSNAASLRYVMKVGLPSSSTKALPLACERRRRLLASFGYTKKELQQAEKQRIRILAGKSSSNSNYCDDDDDDEQQQQQQQQHPEKATLSQFRSIRILQKLIRPLSRRD